MHKVTSAINDFVNLIFPRICSACNQPLLSLENEICLSCIYSLPKTNYHLDNENPLNQIFWGRVDVSFVTSFLHFKKGNKTQKILHQLKYNDAPMVGVQIGKLFGHDLKGAAWVKEIDLVVPVPLHAAKKKKRGYNQSEQIALGLSQVFHVEMDASTLIRSRNASSQTKRNRFDRWKNVEYSFEIGNNEAFRGKNILLVDDVITTGATIEACVKALKPAGCKIFVASIAYTK